MRQLIAALGAGIALALGAVPCAFAQDSELDVTMRVLDDVSGIDAALIVIGNGDAPQGAAGPAAQRDTARLDEWLDARFEGQVAFRPAAAELRANARAALAERLARAYQALIAWAKSELPPASASR